MSALSGDEIYNEINKIEQAYLSDGSFATKDRYKSMFLKGIKFNRSPYDFRTIVLLYFNILTPNELTDKIKCDMIKKYYPHPDIEYTEDVINQIQDLHNLKILGLVILLIIKQKEINKSNPFINNVNFHIKSNYIEWFKLLKLDSDYLLSEFNDIKPTITNTINHLCPQSKYITNNIIRKSIPFCSINPEILINLSDKILDDIIIVSFEINDNTMDKLLTFKIFPSYTLNLVNYNKKINMKQFNFILTSNNSSLVKYFVLNKLIKYDGFINVKNIQSLEIFNLVKYMLYGIIDRDDILYLLNSDFVPDEFKDIYKNIENNNNLLSVLSKHSHTNIASILYLDDEHINIFIKNFGKFNYNYHEEIQLISLNVNYYFPDEISRQLSKTYSRKIINLFN